MSAPVINIMPPNMIQSKWSWVVSYRGRIKKGKASTEAEAWRLGNDASKQLALEANAEMEGLLIDAEKALTMYANNDMMGIGGDEISERIRAFLG